MATAPTRGSAETRTTMMRTPLGRVRGLGSAKNGTHDWWVQRVSSLFLLPLTLWFALAAASLAGASHAEVVAWIARPFNAVMLLSVVALGFHHTAFGLQVVIEDYTTAEWTRIGGILVVRAMCFVLAIAAALAILKIAV